MNTLTGIAIYEPRRLSEKDFLAGFIARSDRVDHLLAQLRRTVETGEARHRVIVGARGMGKTSLLRRLAIGIGSDPGLAGALLPLTFREEQYNVRSLAQFWRNCGEALAEWLEQDGRLAAADALDEELRTDRWSQDEAAGDALIGHLAALQRRAVLFVDNVDLILDALPPEQHWRLRRRLQAAGGPILIGAATQALRQSGDRDAAFYEFFRPEMLEPLTEAELLTCIRRLAEARGSAGGPVVAVLTRQPERLRVLHTLTGGNPRILTLLYQLLERAESETVFDDLEVLLDQMTPLYKSRVEELGTDLQRAMLDAIALHWDPITAHDLSAATAVPVTTVSSQLIRLQDYGYVEVVPTSGSRSGYQIGERFFNIWYLMRHGTRRTRQRLRWLTAFLNSFYTRDDLHRMRGRLVPDAGSRWQPHLLPALEAAIENLNSEGDPATALAGHLARIVPGPSKDVLLREFMIRFSQSLSDGDFAATEIACHETIARIPESAVAWTGLGNVLQDHLERYDEAETAYREAVARDANDAYAWNGLGNLLQRHLGRYAEAETAYHEAIARDPTYASPWNGLGNLLQSHLGRYAEAETAYRRSIAGDPNDAVPWNNLGNLLQGHLGRYEETETAYREAIARDPTYASPWNGLGNLLQDHLGRYAEAETAYRHAMAREPNDASPRNGLGNLLQDHLGRYAEAETAYRGAIAREPHNAILWNGLGNLLQDHLGRYAEAESAYLEAIWIGNDPNVLAKANLAWLRLVNDDPLDVEAVRGAMAATFPTVGRTLLEAAIALRETDAVRATARLDEALGLPLKSPDGPDFSDDLLRLIRLFVKRGYGEHLLAWFDESGQGERNAPLRAAAFAYVRGAQTLRDVNPEVRGVAARLHAWLVSEPAAPAAPGRVKKARGRAGPRRKR